MAAEIVVLAYPRRRTLRPRGLGEAVAAHGVRDDRQVVGRVDESGVLEEAPVAPQEALERRRVVAADAAIEHQQVAAGDDARRIELEIADVAHDLD